MKRQPIRAISPKQVEKQRGWKITTLKKAQDLGFRCQWCGLPLSKGQWSGHHIKHRRYNDWSYQNCFIVHDLIERDGKLHDCHAEADRVKLPYPDENKVGMVYILGVKQGCELIRNHPEHFVLPKLVDKLNSRME